MIDSLDIAEVARRTGLTSRALRFYEARGLVRPLRSASGRRHYGPGELERIHQILTLKRAGLSLAQIERLARRGAVDLAALVDAQIEAVTEQSRQLSETRALLISVKSRIERSEPIDVATFCSLIAQGDKMMTQESWKKVADRYFSPEEQERWNATMDKVPGDFDPDAYNRQWAELGGRIAAALPLNPASKQATALYDEWQALLAPFTAVATPEMMAGATKLYDKMPEWQTDQKPPFDMAVWEFIKSVGAARKA